MYGDDHIDGLMLDKYGVNNLYQNVSEVAVCNECCNSLKGKKMPKYALSNMLYRRAEVIAALHGRFGIGGILHETRHVGVCCVE